MRINPSHVLIVSDAPQLAEEIRSAVSQAGPKCVIAEDAEQAKRQLRSGAFPVMVVCSSMLKISGLGLLAYVRDNAPACRVIVVSGIRDPEYLVEAFRLGAFECFGKPFKTGPLVEAVLAAIGEKSPFRYLSRKAALQAMRWGGEPDSALLENLLALAEAVEARDVYTRRHSEQVAHYAVNLAHWVGVPEKLLARVRVASLLHDVGNIEVPEEVLAKPGPLTEAELECVRRHPVVGQEMLERLGIFSAEVLLVRHHHENWDGSGYPDGLQGEEIPLGARIIRVADAVDAMLMPRSYRDAYPVEKMLVELGRCAAKEFDPRLAAAAVEWCQSHKDELILPAWAE